MGRTCSQNLTPCQYQCCTTYGQGHKIERTWRELHANVTRNHHCDTIDELMAEVDEYLTDRNKKKDAFVVLAA
jgi:hypothetical protein